LRLCFIADGTSTHTKRWVNYFTDKGHEVHLISSRFTEGYEEFDRRIRMHQLVSFFPKLWRVSGYLSGIAWLFQVRAMIIRIKPDIVNAHYIGVPAYLAVVSGFHPLVLTAWGSDILIDPKRNSLRRFLTSRALRKADRIICVSSALKEKAVNLGVAPEKVEVIPMGVDVQKFDPSLRDKALLQNLDMADKPVVISTRNLEPVYDVETLIKAIPLVLREIPEARFIIGGKGKQREHLERLAQDSGISHSVKFVSWIPETDFPKFLASSDVYVSTSLSDGTSVSLLEALASGLAPVVTDIPANRPWISDGENGFLVPVGDHMMLAEKIVTLLRDKGAGSSFGKIGRNIVIERAEYVNQMARVASIYEELKSGRL
jgi:glycosyltransferase involved in cell wall biosynthesis